MGGETSTLHLPPGAPVLPSGWTWSRLDDLCEGIFDCPHSTPRITDSGPFVVRTQDIRSGVFRLEEAAHVSTETYQERIARAEPRFGDLLYSREGTYFGIAAEVPSDVRVCLGQRMVLIRPSAEKVISRYLRFWLNSPHMVGHVHGQRDGSVAERLNLPTIRRLPVALPPLSEQKRIADILGSLDEKIELNRRMSETLEAMARALFKSWFVDFDPVRSKAEERETGLPEEIAKLFPDGFEESEVGEVPRGWSAGTFGEIAQHSRRVLAPSEIAADRPYIALEHMPKRSIALNEWEPAAGLQSNKYEFHKGDILFGKLRPYFHKVGVAPVDGVCSTDIVVLKPSALHWFGLALGHASSDEFVRHTNAGSTGTRMPSVLVQWECDRWGGRSV